MSAAVAKGDLVKLTKGEEVRIGRVKEGSYGLYVANLTDATITREGWTVEVVERFVPPLPKEPGFYGSTDPRNADGTIWLLSPEGKWSEWTSSGRERQGCSSTAFLATLNLRPMRQPEEGR